VRVGLALSDPTGIIAQPLQVVDARNVDALFAELRAIASERQVGELVVGLPLRLDGEEGPAAAAARAFAERLGAALKLPVTLWDERLSTAGADRAMLDSDLSRAQRRKRRDKVAAQIFLQSYLDAQRSRGSQ
jgi:putative Holliday junction resolvase